MLPAAHRSHLRCGGLYCSPRAIMDRFGPKQETVLAGRKLACLYVELVLLRRLGYTGHISNGLGGDPSVGQTVPVPWAKG